MTDAASKENLLAALGQVAGEMSSLNDQLERQRIRRDAVIVALRNRNATIREIAYYSGLTTRRVSVILDRDNRDR